MHGFPGRRTVTLRCELFGQAGDYYLTLRPAAAAEPQDLASAFIKVTLICNDVSAVRLAHDNAKSR